MMQYCAGGLGANYTQLLPQTFGGEDLEMFSPLKDLPTSLLQTGSSVYILFPPLPLVLQDGTHPAFSWWIQAYLNPCQDHHLLQESIGMLSFLKLHRRRAGWEVILPKAKWSQQSLLPPQA